MRKDLITAACIGILSVTLLSNSAIAGEKEFFTEEDVQDSYRMVESLREAPELGNITRANVWIKEADDRAKAQEAARRKAKIAKAKIVVAKAPAPKPVLAVDQPKISLNEKKADSYMVQKGDTLFGIVEKLAYKDIDKTRTAVALWQSNKDSFIAGNLNGVIPGKTLELNEVSKNIEGIDSKTAKGIIQSQWKEWKTRNTPANKKASEEAGPAASKSTGEKRVAEKTPGMEKTPAESKETKKAEDNKPITVSNLIDN